MKSPAVVNGPGADGAPRVCIVRQTDVYELSLRREAEALVAAGYEVDVICMRHPERASVTRVDGVTLLSLPVSHMKGGKLRYVADYLAFLVLAGAHVAVRHVRLPYRVVQVNTMPDLLVLAALVPRLLGAKVIVFMKEPVPELGETLFGPGPLMGVLKQAERVALRFADHVFTVSEQLKQRYVEAGAPVEKITVVLNCPAPSNLLRRRLARPRTPAEDGQFTIVCHGSIEDRYGYDTILHAVSLARRKIPRLALMITGRGSWVEEMLSMVEALDLKDVVRYEGWVSQERLAEILASAHVGIVAQKASPYSHLVHTNKMVDYWVFGLPVIASRLRAVSETFDERVIEYFEPGDAADLASKIIHLFCNPARRAELSRNGRHAEEHFGWTVQQRAYLGVYEALAPTTSA